MSDQPKGMSMIKRTGITLAAVLTLAATATYALRAQEEKKMIQTLVERTKQNMVFVEGGTYMMGDFGTIQGMKYHDGKDREAELQYSPDDDNKPAHKVTVDSFSISKYKVTYEDFDIYTDANHLPRIAMDDFSQKSRHPKVTAGVTWAEAKAYCAWLSQLTSQTIDLPTEAQWEYAARSRGQFFPYPTDTGWREEGKNFASFDDTVAFWKKERGRYGDSFIAVGMYPPNPLGLFDMGCNGFEWMQDWYDPDYYQHSPELNPKGPDHGTYKVMRSRTPLEGDVAFTFDRHKDLPIPMTLNAITEKPEPLDPVDNGFRIVINSNKKIQ